MSLTDKQLLSIFTQSPAITDHNGRTCSVVLRENGLLGTERVCDGHSVIENGKVVLRETCGEPCTFVCKRAEAFSREVEAVKVYERFIELAKRES